MISFINILILTTIIIVVVEANDGFRREGHVIFFDNENLHHSETGTVEGLHRITF
jgi:hypothetical protein